jgi:hypothetical protein
MRKVICFAVSHSILARWRNYFSQLLNVHGLIDVSQTGVHTAEPLVTEPSAFEVDLAIQKLKTHKLPGIDQILAELFKAGGRKIRCEIHKRILFGIRRNCLRSGRSRPLSLCIRRSIKEIYLNRPITFANYVQDLSNILLSN